MLKPSYIEQLPKRLIELYSEVEIGIIAHMAERIKAQNMFIPSVQWQYQKLIEMGNFHSYIVEALASQLGTTRQEIERLMMEAGQKAIALDTTIYRKAGLSPPTISQSFGMQQAIRVGYDNTMGLFENLTRTTANTATNQFEQVLDKTWLNVNSGAFSHTEATKIAIDDLAGKGLKAVEYPSGHTDYLDVAVRRATVTGVNQTAAKVQEALADELDSDLVETTAHSGARPSHAEWQGKVFSRSGTSKKYPPFRESTGYGTGAGLCGWNCRHSFFPFFEGSEPAYTQAELDEMNAKNIEYNGKMYSEYEATQIQRGYERNIRRSKREIAAAKAADLPDVEQRTKASLAKYQRNQADFIKQTGLKRQYDREKVSFGVKNNAKSLDKSVESGIIKEINKKPITKITDSVINKVPTVEINEYSSEQNVFVQEQHKELLKYARDENDSNEVAFVFDEHFKIRKEYKGTDDRLDFGGTLYGKDLFVMHNHPRNSSFSDSDLVFFQQADNVKYLSIIKHNSGIELLTKSEMYDKLILKAEYHRLSKKLIKQGTPAEFDKLIRTLLTKTKSGVEWRAING